MYMDLFYCMKELLQSYSIKSLPTYEDIPRLNSPIVRKADRMSQKSVPKLIWTLPPNSLSHIKVIGVTVYIYNVM